MGESQSESSLRRLAPWQFVVLEVDESQAGASGCSSIDSSRAAFMKA